MMMIDDADNDDDYAGDDEEFRNPPISYRHDDWKCFLAMWRRPRLFFNSDQVVFLWFFDSGQVVFGDFFDSGQVVFGDAITEEEVAKAIWRAYVDSADALPAYNNQQCNNGNSNVNWFQKLNYGKVT